MNSFYHARAKPELDEALAFYESKQPGLSFEFLDEVERAIRRIVESPNTLPVYDGDVRYCRTHRFPYIILYRIRGEEVEIIAVKHDSRREDYWKDRLR